MQVKDELFPEENKKVTDKYLRQVLVTSICGILLCMSCLVAMTWAWFEAGVENSDNVIYIATEPPKVEITLNGESIPVSVPNLPAGEHTLNIVHSGDVDDVQRKSKLYVTFSVDEIVHGYVLLDYHNGYATTVDVVAPHACVISWTVSWFMPDGAQMLENPVIDLSVAAESDPTEQTTAPTQTPTLNPENQGEPNSETTAPVEETTQPTTAETNPPQQTTNPSETETEASQPTEGANPQS